MEANFKEIEDALMELCGPGSWVSVTPPSPYGDYFDAHICITDPKTKNEWRETFSREEGTGNYWRGVIEWAETGDKNWEDAPRPIPNWISNTFARAFTAFCLLV